MKPDVRLRLIHVLTETNDRLKAGDNVSWEGLSPAEAAMDIELACSRLQGGGLPDLPHLRMLFAPTGIIQECAIANHWSDEYLRLSSAFDEIAEKKA